MPRSVRVSICQLWRWHLAPAIRRVNHQVARSQSPMRRLSPTLLRMPGFRFSFAAVVAASVIFSGTFAEVARANPLPSPAFIRVTTGGLPPRGIQVDERDLFILSVAPAAQESQRATGVPAAVTIAQAILESSWGKSRLSREANNYFGIKAHTGTGSNGTVHMNTGEVINGKSVMMREPFRAYDSPEESFVDHGRFLTENPRYHAALAVRDDPRRFAQELQRGGYATDPSYADKLILLMEKYDLFRFNVEEDSQ